MRQAGDYDRSVIPPRLGVHGAVVAQSLQAASARYEPETGTEDSLGGDSSYQLNKDQMEELRSMFETFDRDGDQTVSPTEIRWLLRHLGHNPSAHDINKFVSEMDADGNGAISQDEFITFMSERLRKPPSERTLLSELREVFRVYCGSESSGGRIDAKQLAVVVRVGLEMKDVTDAEVGAMLRAADTDGDGLIDWEDFYAVMTIGQQLPPPVQAPAPVAAGAASSAAATAASASSAAAARGPS